MTARRYDVYRDADGNPVTITEEQMRAIWHALRVRAQVIHDAEVADPAASMELLSKSRLLGRMLIDGRPPFSTAPPTITGGARDYLALEPGLHHYYAHGGGAVVATEAATVLATVDDRIVICPHCCGALDPTSVFADRGGPLGYVVHEPKDCIRVLRERIDRIPRPTTTESVTDETS